MVSLPTSVEIVSFDDFQANLRSRELLRHGSKVRLPDQSFQILAMLIERAGDMVTREEIKAKLWPSDTFVDFDHGLNNAVNRLREALGDSAGAPRYIETLPRRGYRFLGTINRSTAAEETFREKGPPSQPREKDTRTRTRRPDLRRSSVYGWLLLSLSAVAALSLLIVGKIQNRATPPSSRTFVLPADGTTFNLIGDEGGSVALSPSGTSVAFVAINVKGTAQIWVRPLGKLTATAIDGTEGASFPFWSPNGESIGFFAHGKLKKVRADGSTSAVVLCEASFGRGGSWNSSGVIIFAPTSHSGIFRVSEGGGVPISITTVDDSIHTTHRWPKFLPDGVHFIYLAASHFNPPTHDGVYLGSLNEGATKFIIPTNADATYASGYLFFLHNNALIAQRFDYESGQLRGEPLTTSERVLYDPIIWKAVFDVSDHGVMAYELGDRVRGNEFHWFDRTGKQLGVLGEPSFQWEPSISRDGQKLAVGIGDGGYSHLWVYELARGTRKQITFGKYDNGSPVWSANGRYIIFAAKRQHYGLYQVDSTGAEPERLILDTGRDAWPLDLSPDGEFLLYGEGLAIGKTQSHIWIYPMSGSHHPYRLLEEEALETDAQFSPDGHWVAYTSNESGRDEVYVVPFVDRSSSGPTPSVFLQSKRQISTTGGHTPRWRRNSAEIFYLSSDNTITTVPVMIKGSRFAIGTAHPLFHANPSFYSLSYDASPDGSRFVVNTAPKEKTAPITVVANWLSDFK